MAISEPDEDSAGTSPLPASGTGETSAELPDSPSVDEASSDVSSRESPASEPASDDDASLSSFAGSPDEGPSAGEENVVSSTSSASAIEASCPAASSDCAAATCTMVVVEMDDVTSRNERNTQSRERTRCVAFCRLVWSRRLVGSCCRPVMPYPISKRKNQDPRRKVESPGLRHTTSNSKAGNAFLLLDAVPGNSLVFPTDTYEVVPLLGGHRIVMASRIVEGGSRINVRVEQTI